MVTPSPYSPRTSQRACAIRDIDSCKSQVLCGVPLVRYILCRLAMPAKKNRVFRCPITADTDTTGGISCHICDRKVDGWLHLAKHYCNVHDVSLTSMKGSYLYTQYRVAKMKLATMTEDSSWCPSRPCQPYVHLSAFPRPLRRHCLGGCAALALPPHPHPRPCSPHRYLSNRHTEFNHHMQSCMIQRS